MNAKNVMTNHHHALDMKPQMIVVVAVGAPTVIHQKYAQLLQVNLVDYALTAIDQCNLKVEGLKEKSDFWGSQTRTS